MTNEEMVERIEELEEEVEELEDDKRQLEKENEELLDTDELVKALKIYADHTNWNGTHFAPVELHLQTGQPDDIAREALNASN